MTVYVCPTKDIECGDRPGGWCEKCPKKLRGSRLGVATRELKFHPSASHINPDYRDGWNAAIEQVARLLEANPPFPSL